MISENFKIIRSQIPENICLVAVSKTKPKELILEAYNLGQRHFGENKVKEANTKWKSLLEVNKKIKLQDELLTKYETLKKSNPFEKFKPQEKKLSTTENTDIFRFVVIGYRCHL